MAESRAGTRKAFLGALPASFDAAQAAIANDDDGWWACAAAVAAVRAAPHWKAADAAQLLSSAAARTAAFDNEVYAAFSAAKKGASFTEWLDDERLARLLLRRQLWHMQWLLCVPLAASKTAAVGADIAQLANSPVLFHAHSLALAGNARALRALLGAHPAVARALFPYRFRLLHTLVTAGGQHADVLRELRLLPGTHMPVQDRESGAWIDSVDASPNARPALWVEHPIVTAALAELGVGAPPPKAPEPPSALVEWYAELVAELGSELGLVDDALGLATAAVSVGLTPLRAAANELGFVVRLGGSWRVASLRAASFSEIVRALATSDDPSALEEALRAAVPFFRTGAYADAEHVRTLPEDALVSRMLLVLVDGRREPALRLVERVVSGSWISAHARAALVLAVTLGWQGASGGAYAALEGMLRALAAEARVGAPLMLLLQETLRARAASVPELWALLCEVEGADVSDALSDAAAYVALGAAVRRWVPRAPRELAASDSLSERLGTTLCDAALSQPTPREAIAEMFAAVEPHTGGLVDASVLTTILVSLLRAQRYPLFHMVVADLDGSPGLAAALGPGGADELVLAEARRAFDAARTCDASSGPLRRARQSLAAATQTPEIARELAVVDTVARLAEYDLRMPDGTPLTPAEVRDAREPLDVLARVLAVHGGAYRQADEMIALALALATLPGASAPADVHVSVFAMLVDAAMAADDLPCARAYCDRLVVQAQRASPAGRDAAWRACFQLGKHPDWRNAQAQAQVLGSALTLAPPEQIPRVLSQWQTLDGAALVPARALPARDTLSRLLGAKWSRPAEPLGRAASLFDGVATPTGADRAARAARSLWDGLGDEAPITGSLRGAVGWLMGDERR